MSDTTVNTFKERFRFLIQCSFSAADLVGIHRKNMYLLTISFALFILIVSIVYSSPKLIHREGKNRQSVVSRIPYHEPNYNLAVERDVEALAVNDFVEGMKDAANFFPNDSDIQILDESRIYFIPQTLGQLENPEVIFRSDDVGHEALTAVKMSLKHKQRNNLEKAEKFLRHAIALSPKHHNVFQHYYEFLESDEDFTKSKSFRLQTLTLRPKVSQTLAKSTSILPVVNQPDLDELQRIDAKRDTLMGISTKDPSLRRMKKEIYFQHIYHTLAIEGNTISLSDIRTVLETRLAAPGKSISENNEILGLETALRYVKQTLAKEDSPITVKHILEIHKRVMGHVDPLTAGTFRKVQVFVGEHVPPAASDVEALMNEFVSAINSPDVRKMHTIHMAAFAHHKLVFIHPFVDGNGRTARVLMNLVFIRHGYPPIIIRKDDKYQYFKLLQVANEVDLLPFYRFIAQATENTIDVYLQSQSVE